MTDVPLPLVFGARGSCPPHSSSKAIIILVNLRPNQILPAFFSSPINTCSSCLHQLFKFNRMKNRTHHSVGPFTYIFLSMKEIHQFLLQDKARHRSWRRRRRISRCATGRKGPRAGRPPRSTSPSATPKTPTPPSPTMASHTVIISTLSLPTTRIFSQTKKNKFHLMSSTGDTNDEHCRVVSCRLL